MGSSTDHDEPSRTPRATVDASVRVDDLPTTAVVIEIAGTSRLHDLARDGELLIGRTEACQISVEDERVSRRHLRLSLRDGRLCVEDLDSRNGTSLNGRRLRGERLLRGGDEIVAGPVLVRAGGPRPPADLLDEGDLIDRLDEELHRARSFRRPLGVIGMIFQGSRETTARALAELVARSGRGAIVGEYADGRALVLLPERDRARANAQAAADVAVATALGAVLEARAAAFPEDGASADELIDAVMRRAAPVDAGGDEAGELVVEDAATRAIFEAARRAARSTSTVLVTGESGVGKEWIAREIHRHSPRAQGPFVQINCAALPESLAESELFGHERGAFTGADQARVGLIEAAHGGTLLLDEIGELSPAVQAKLLRVLEDRRVQRVGATQAKQVDLRFVAATNRDLAREVRAGRFREDLYYRINTITLSVPPLRERPGDLRALVPVFVRSASRAAGVRAPSVTDAFVSGLASYHWPGNVRELRNVIERAVVLGDGGALGLRHLPARFSAGDLPSEPEGPMRKQLDGVERQSIEAALAETQGNRTHAARKLGISRRALIYKLHKHGLIDPED